MTTFDALDESVAKGQTQHWVLHSDLARRVNAIAALLGYDTEVASATVTLLSALVTGDNQARLVIRADGTIAMGGAPLTVSTVSGTTTVTVTTTANHGLGTADVVTISGVAGFSGANGTWTITRTGATTFTLDGATGSGSYTSGGKVQRLLGTSGSANEGVWNLAVPEGETTRYGLAVRLNSSSSKAGFIVFDHQAAPIFFVNPSGGAALTSAAAADAISAAASTSTSARKFAATAASGTVRLAAGDPGSGAGVLAVGNASTEPSADPDGTHNAETSYTTSAGVVVWSRGGRLQYRTSAGLDDELAAPVRRRQASIAAPGGDTSLVVDGTLPPTVATTNITATSDDQAGGPLVKYTTTASSGVDAGVISAFGLIQPRWAPLFYARVQTDASAITSTRLVAGLVSAEIASDAGPASTGAYAVAAGAWLRYDTAVDGTAFWRTVTSSGSNATITTTSASIAVDTSYELLIECNSAATSWRFWVGSTLVATHSTNLPSTSAALGYTARLRTLAAAARALRLGRITWSSK